MTDPDDMVSRLIGEGMDPDAAGAAAERDQAWRDHDMWDSAKYAYNRLGPMRMTPERLAALDALWPEYMTLEELAEQRVRAGLAERWKLMYQAPVHPQGWMCQDCWVGNHNCRQPLYDPSMENQERCICCGQERDGRD